MSNISEAHRLVNLAVGDTNQDHAVPLLWRAMSLDPDSKLAYYHLGLIYASRGMCEQAGVQFHHIVTAIDPDDAPAWFLYARQLHLGKHLDEARSAYEETMRRDPLCEKAYLYTAQILLDAGGEESRALSMAEAAMRLRPATCILPVEDFEAVLARARQDAPMSPSLTRESPNGAESGSANTIETMEATFGSASVRVLLERYPEIAETLEDCGISCGDCAGYGDQTLADIARALDLDCDFVSTRVSLAIEDRG